MCSLISKSALAGLAATILLLVAAWPARAGLVTVEERYSYEAGESDSKLTCRAVSLLEVKRLLLERLGTYIRSTSQVVDLQLTRDEVTSLSAGIVQTEILDESWDGRTYTLTARIQADPEAVTRMLGELASTGRKTNPGTYLVEADGGRLQVRGCSFGSDEPAIALRPGIQHAILAENNGVRGVEIANEIGAKAILANNEPPAPASK